jgi:hypothetical protein
LESASPIKPETFTLTRKEFDDLLEYSCTLPTGTTIGKRWKRDVNSRSQFRLSKIEETEMQILGPEWWMGEYAECEPPEADKVAIIWRKIAIKEET